MRWTSATLISLLLVLTSFATSVPQGPQWLVTNSDARFVESDNNASELAFGWVTSAGGASDDFISQSTTYENGTFLVAGSFKGDIQFRDQIDGHGAAGGSTDRDAVLGWINPNGTWNASLAFGSTGVDSLEAVSLLPGGDLIVAGNYCLNSAGFACQLTLGDLPSLTKSDEDDDGNVFLARLSGEGEWVWAEKIGNAYDNFVFDMLVAPNNEIHLGVLYRNSMNFNGEIIPAGGQNNLIIATFNEGGETLSHVSLGAQNGMESIGGLCQDGAGQIYVAATYYGEVLVGETLLSSQGESDVVVASYQGDEWAWAVSGGGILEDRLWDCSGSPGQGLSVVGEFVGNATFGSFSTEASASTDMLLGLVSSSGAWSSIAIAGGIGVDRATSVMTNAQGDITLTGTTAAGLTIGVDALPDLDGKNDDMHNDIFLATYLQNGTWAWAISAGGDGNDEPTDLTFALDGSPLLTFMLSGTASIGVHNASSYGGYDVGVWLYQTDRDGDGVLDGEDNCPRVKNTGQANHDSDLFGDDCDDDDDNDGMNDGIDDCPTGALAWTSDASSDHDSDGCQDEGEDFDDDEDTVFDFNDLCPFGPVGWISTPEEDSEGDGCADYDTDEDGFIDQMDNCPLVANPTQGDLDNDGLGDACDVDEDGDGIAAPDDNCPRDNQPWSSNAINDHDQDGCHDSITDNDDDDDGIQDSSDACPSGDIAWNNPDTSLELDHDQDGCKDATEDNDDDNDGYDDSVDSCPIGLVGIALEGQDVDQDGCIDGAEDDDDDNDGVNDAADACPRTPANAQVGVQGCAMTQLDGDLDGVSNAEDMCLNTLPGRLVDESGCAVLNQTNEAVAEGDGNFSMTTALFVLAALLLVIAGAVAVYGTPPASATKQASPPKRPANLDIATTLETDEQEE